MMRQLHVVCFDGAGTVRAISRAHDPVTALVRCREVAALGIASAVVVTSRAVRAERERIERSAAPPIACRPPKDVLGDVERHKEDPAA
jgi:hypothetical protein